MKNTEDRKVSFIDIEADKWLKENKDAHYLCSMRFKADYVIELKGKKIGDCISIDKGIVEITQMGKRCFEECEFIKKSKVPCPLANGVAFAKIKSV